MYTNNKDTVTDAAGYGGHLSSKVFDSRSARINPWTTTAADMPRFRSLHRVAQRHPAVHDPLLTPSAADITTFARAVISRAENGLLESIDDAISSPLPRSETHMVGVKSDNDLGIPSVASNRCRAATSPIRSQTTILKNDSLPTNGKLGGLAISVSSKSSFTQTSNTNLRPQSIPNVAIPARLGEDIVVMSRSYAEISLSDAGSSPTSSVGPLASDASPLRSIKMIRHQVQESDTLERLSVHYGISVSHLKRLNRLWHSSEIATRDYLYIPLRMCHPRYTPAYVEFVNNRYKNETLREVDPNIKSIDLIEVVLDHIAAPSMESQSLDCLNHTHKHPWPLIPYSSIQKYFSFTL
ncbi:hypothetical protein GGI25_000685 [Coemansia spiralis]|uniref:LysM domain-containing protein n=2 Tax=Coemansia TaxID=4863 RepID=A0A9W8GBW2_9FUNG|nr:hypothetical protein EDC05_000643 [Coemansia umbellata]KAJ2623687.1 hypothetical protein GGI26_002134 [Coemansia sp. RSA 1358]KAJ2680393.1 hypothetical protein GGI25_000685 [Coemansia spiralis]